MSSVAFDQTRADALVNEIGQMVIIDPNYARSRLERYRPGRRGHQAQAHVRLRLSPGWRLGGGDARRFRRNRPRRRTEQGDGPPAAMAGPGACVQISRPGPKIVISFDYDDKGDWVVTLDNHEEMIDRLKP